MMSTQASEPQPTSRRSYFQKLWVPVVLLVGLIAGELISMAATERQPDFFAQGPFGPFHPFPTDPLFSYHVILTTVEVSLLIALVVLYAKMFVETRANFALGLVVVLVALLVQATLSYPVIDDLFFSVLMPEPGYWSPAADTLTICAYTVFLYLSLE